jgi:hypothetical protein
MQNLRGTVAGLIGLACVVSSGAVHAQTVDEIVARHVEARGGEARLKAVQTVKMTRTVAAGIGSALKVTVYKKRPALMRLEQQSTLPGAPMIPRGVNGEGAWDFVQGKPSPRPPQLSAETRDLDGDFDGPLVDWRAKGHVVTVAGRESMPGGEAIKLKVVMKSGLERMVYLDAKTYLDRKHTGLLNLPGNRQFDIVVTFDGWREVEGVKFPFDITEERTGKEPVVTLVTYTEKIELNQPMDDALFDPPPAAAK